MRRIMKLVSPQLLAAWADGKLKAPPRYPSTMYTNGEIGLANWLGRRRATQGQISVDVIWSLHVMTKMMHSTHKMLTFREKLRNIT